MKKSVAIPDVDLSYQVYASRGRHTCIQVSRSKTHVKFIPLVIDAGFNLETWTAKMFDERFNLLLSDYPAERAARLYLGFAKTCGATRAALDYLGRIVKINEKEYNMAANRKTVADTAREDRQASQAARDVHMGKMSKKSLSELEGKAPKASSKKPAAVKSVAKAPAEKPKGDKKPSAASMFMELIMAGKLTDDQIFAKVKEKFDLDDSKRSYVGWYRAKLRKDGMSPPSPKGAK